MQIRRLAIAVMVLASASFLLYGCASADLAGLAPAGPPSASASGDLQAQRFDQGAYVLTTSIYGANVDLMQGSSGTPVKQYQLLWDDLVASGLHGFSTSLSYIVSPSTDQLLEVDKANSQTREVAMIIASITGSRSDGAGNRAFAPWLYSLPVWIFLPGVSTDWIPTYANWGDTVCAAQYNVGGNAAPSTWDLWIGGTLMKVSQSCAQLFWDPGILPGVHRG